MQHSFNSYRITWLPLLTRQLSPRSKSRRLEKPPQSRRTFATNLTALGVPPHITQRLLNHVTGTISREVFLTSLLNS